MASRLIHTPRAHIHPAVQHCPYVPGWGSLTVMTSTQQAARAAAQLHEAAQDVARVAARRSARAEGRMPVQQGHELTEGLWPKSGTRRVYEEWEEKQAERSADPVKDARVGGPDRYRAATSGYTRFAARPPVPGGYGGPFASVAHAAPFAAGWPHRTFLELGALPSAVPCARLHTRQVLWEWGLAGLSESTELLVAELTTNAMQVSHAAMQDDPIRLWLVSDKMHIVILVWDASPLPPVPIHVGDDAENGRGLLLVQAVSARWGWHFPPDIGGKVVWAQAPLE